MTRAMLLDYSAECLLAETIQANPSCIVRLKRLITHWLFVQNVGSNLAIKSSSYQTKIHGNLVASRALPVKDKYTMPSLI